ncbi:MAG: hypothetical protein LBM78_00165 [Clostridiales bacterium]|nr:hypothetical protein [Clostridiales bacterium]
MNKLLYVVVVVVVYVKRFSPYFRVDLNFFVRNLHFGAAGYPHCFGANEKAARLPCGFYTVF